MYLIKFTDDGLADVKALPANVRNSLKKEMKELASNPEGFSEELTGSLEGWRSFHYRNYRVVFKLYEDLKAIAVAGIGERHAGSDTDIYKKLSALAEEGKLAEKVLITFRDFAMPSKEKGKVKEKNPSSLHASHSAASDFQAAESLSCSAVQNKGQAAKG